MRIAAMVLALLAGGCSQLFESDSAEISRLEREARALANASGCASVAECRAAPVGDRPCGGPRTYLVYCSLTTDSAALYRKLAELRDAEREWNRTRGIGSTCEFRSPPPLEAVSGICRAR